MSLSKQDLSYFDPFDNTKYIPYVVEPSIGLSRLTLAAICNAYDEIETEEGNRVVLRFHPRVAPVKVAVFPIVKKLAEKGRAIFDLLASEFQVEYDETGAVGKRYYRADEMGIPFSIVVDDEHYDAGTVTVRHRDSGEQEVVRIDELVEWVRTRVR